MISVPWGWHSYHNNVVSMDDLFYIVQDWLSTGQEY